ncbi:hypothetical protein ACEZCY_14435 [Streptacidiphilus sp. N1-12]|uniref:XRE family transcriptional regulator n=2 Tax=Streptacidiphilus alkalitolerans TaxID=3342712 RepID=A0ABV6WEE6_9ACTN
MSSEPTRPRALSEVGPELTADLDRDDLSRLVRQVNDSGVSYQQMADRAAAEGHVISKPYFQKLATKATKSAPSPDQLRAIAAGLRKPITIVRAAAAVQFLEFESRELAGYGDSVKVIVAHLAGMTEAEVNRWRTMIEADERARREQQSD